MKLEEISFNIYSHHAINYHANSFVIASIMFLRYMVNRFNKVRFAASELGPLYAVEITGGVGTFVVIAVRKCTLSPILYCLLLILGCYLVPWGLFGTFL